MALSATNAMETLYHQDCRKYAGIMEAVANSTFVTLTDSYP